MVSTTARREAVEWLRETRSTSLRRACRAVGLSTATWRYRLQLSAVNAQLLAKLHTHARREVDSGIAGSTCSSPVTAPS